MVVGVAGDPVGLVFDLDIGNAGAEFFVLVGTFYVPAPSGEADERAVHQLFAAGRDDGAVGGGTYEFADAQGFVGVGEYLGVGVAAFVAEGDGGFCPGGVDEPFADGVVVPELLFVFFRVVAGASWYCVGVLFVVEDGHEIVGGAAPAVVAYVYDEPLFSETGGGEFAFDHFEAGEVHAADMDIA